MLQSVVPKTLPGARGAGVSGLGLSAGTAIGTAGLPTTSATRKDLTAEYAELLRSIPQLAPLGEVREMAANVNNALVGLEVNIAQGMQMSMLRQRLLPQLSRVRYA